VLLRVLIFRSVFNLCTCIACSWWQ